MACFIDPFTNLPIMQHAPPPPLIGSMGVPTHTHISSTRASSCSPRSSICGQAPSLGDCDSLSIPDSGIICSTLSSTCSGTGSGSGSGTGSGTCSGTGSRPLVSLTSNDSVDCYDSFESSSGEYDSSSQSGSYISVPLDTLSIPDSYFTEDNVSVSTKTEEIPKRVVLPRNKKLRNKIVCYINKALAIMEQAHMEGYEKVREEQDETIKKLEAENAEIAALLQQYNVPIGLYGMGLDCGSFEITPTVNDCALEIVKEYMGLSDCQDMSVTFEEMEYAVLLHRQQCP